MDRTKQDVKLDKNPWPNVTESAGVSLWPQYNGTLDVFSSSNTERGKFTVYQVPATPTVFSIQFNSGISFMCHRQIKD